MTGARSNLHAYSITFSSITSNTHLNMSNSVAVASNGISSRFMAAVLAHDDGKEASCGSVSGEGGGREVLLVWTEGIVQLHC